MSKEKLLEVEGEQLPFLTQQEIEEVSSDATGEISDRYLRIVMTDNKQQV